MTHCRNESHLFVQQKFEFIAVAFGVIGNFKRLFLQRMDKYMPKIHFVSRTGVAKIDFGLVGFHRVSLQAVYRHIVEITFRGDENLNKNS